MGKIAICASLLIAGVACKAETYYLITDGTAKESGTTAFKNAKFWLDAEGNPSGEDGSALDPNADYVMTATLRQNNKDNTYSVFGGASLRVGTTGSSTGVCMLQYYDKGTEFKKLYLTRGYYVANRGHNISYYLNADIVVDSPLGSDFIMAVSYTNCALIINGSLSADATCGLVLQNKNPNYTEKKHTTDYHLNPDDVRDGFVLDADLSGFYGTMRLGRTTGLQLAASPSMWEIKAVIPRDVEMPGSMVVPSYDILSISNSATFKVGNLSLAGGSMLQYHLKEGQSGTIAVTDRLNISGKVGVNVNPDMFAFVGGRYTLLSAPNTDENRFEASNFELMHPNWSVPPSLFVEVDEATNTRKLVLTSNEWLSSQCVRLITSDYTKKDYKDTIPESNESALTNAAQWSNSQIPNGNYDYAVLPGEASNWSKTYALRTLKSGGSDTFAGRSLTIGRNCILYVMTRYMTFDDLRLLDQSILACPNTGSADIKGNIHAPCGSVRLRQYVRRSLNICAKVTGSAELVIEGWDSTGSATGWYDFSDADMTNFYGTIRITEHPSMRVPDYRPAGTNQTLFVSSYAGEVQLGGKLPEFNPKALTIERCGTLSLNAGNTLNITTNYNRGIYVNGNGRIAVQSAWHKLNITTRLTVNGTLAKDGGGSLVLGGECVPEGEAPTLDIWSNDVVVASAKAVNGLTVKIGENARLVLKANPEDELLCEYGMRLDRSETPFVLDDGLTKLPLAVDCSAMSRPKEAIDIALLTVASDAADNVESMLPVLNSPFPRMEANLVRRENDDGTITFVLKLTLKGFVMVLR